MERVGVGTSEYTTNKWEIYDRSGHHNLYTDLVKHIFHTYLNLVAYHSNGDLYDDIGEESDMFKDDSSEDFNDVMNDNEEWRIILICFSFIWIFNKIVFYFDYIYFLNN